MVDSNLRQLLMEATDNERFLTSIQDYWTPLYIGTPNEISDCLPHLLKVLRGIYDTSRYFNTTLHMASFLSKLAAHMISSSQKYLSKNGTISIWTEDKEVMVEKINECKRMQHIYREGYEEMLAVINSKADKDKPLDCSSRYLFDRMDLFNDRLSHIRAIMDTCILYKVLNRVKIGGMEVFLSRIENAFDRILRTTYDPLIYRENYFEKDFILFKKEIDLTECEMEDFVKKYVEQIETSEQRILTLKRFEKLNLMCLKMVDRYIDVATLLLKEIEEIKDNYNMERIKPPNEWLVPSYVSRIKWTRAMVKKIQVPLESLKQYVCVNQHKTTQKCIKMFNFLATMLSSYEATLHKAWFTYVEQIRSKLEVPILKKNTENNHYELNLNSYVLQTIKETESMWKLGLEVPKSIGIVTYCKDNVLNAYNTIEELLRRNNQLRRSIYPIFLPLMRVHLIKLERIFAPALSQITWLTFEINDYFDKIAQVLEPIEDLVKKINDINDAQIEAQLKVIENLCLIELPEEPVTPKQLSKMNISHRQNMEKIIISKSTSAEKAAVDLINYFVEKAENIPLYDKSGKFKLPLSEIDDNNRRFEELKPINKYDWLSFDKMFSPVGYASPDENEINVFKDYDGLNYDVVLLHIDCVELFAHYNHRMIAVLAKSTKRSMELLKARSSLTSMIRTYDCHNREYETLLSAKLELKIPDFILKPDIFEINEYYTLVLNNIIETHIAVSTWGQQAKIPEREFHRQLLSEIRHQRNWKNIISDHKDVSRYRISFDDGVMQLQPEINKMLDKLFETFNYLWDEKCENMLEKFVKSNPLTANIRDRLIQYDKITAGITQLEPILCFGLIQIDRSQMIEMLIAQSNAWKKLLGKKLCEFYKVILDKNVNFIEAQQKILDRKIETLDDCRLAMDCLKLIRDNFIEIDQDLMLIDQTYAVFHQFHLNVPPYDVERVDGLRLQFTILMETSKVVAEKVLNKQKPLLQELEDGVTVFKDTVLSFDQEFIEKGPMVEGIAAKEASDRVLIFSFQLEMLQNQFEVLSSGEELFGLPVNDYPILQKRKRDINYLNRLYKLYLDVMYTVDEYFVLAFNEVDMEQINSEIHEFVNRCRLLPKGMKNWPAFIDLKKKIDDFNECCPLIELMSSNAMKERHWKSLEDKLKYRFDVDDPKFTLDYVMKAPLLNFKEDIEEICGSAIKELDIETKLQGVIKEWKDVDMPLAPFKSRGNLLIKASEVLEIVTKLEDSLMIMSSLASNRFNAPLKKEIMLWLHKLSDTNEILEKWLQVQSLWMYLEAVFVGGDISRQLPQEAKRFGNIDKGWIKIMYKTRDVSKVIEICTGDDIVSRGLTLLLEQLELCQKSLTVYLESKRLIFPRFFFISDPVLLEILGQASDPTSIQPHLLSIFDGVARVEFDEEHPETIVSMFSSNGEKIPLLNSVRCIGLVEVWIGKLLDAVLETVKNILGRIGMQISDSKFDYKTQLSWLCAQAQLICIQLLWTMDAEYALNLCKNDRRIMAKKNVEMQEMLNFLVDQTVKDLTKLERISYETLVTIHVHQRDIFDDLVRMKIKSPNDFEWQKQARFYYDAHVEEIFVKITDIDFVYQNEYLGVTDRLAITPLTDRCYITLAQAIGMNMGGAPAG